MQYEKFWSGRVRLTNDTASTVKASPGTAMRLAVYGLAIKNGDAAVGTDVEIREGTTVKQQWPAGANGDGLVIASPVPILILDYGTALTARATVTSSESEVVVWGEVIP